MKVEFVEIHEGYTIEKTTIPLPSTADVSEFIRFRIVRPDGIICHEQADCLESARAKIDKMVAMKQA